MLYFLLFPLYKRMFVFNIFRYITFRTIMALITALVLSFWIGKKIVRFLKKRHIGENIRPEGPPSHVSKKGTPTMGGLVILFSTILSSLLWADVTNVYVLIVLISTVWMGVLGFLDDYVKVLGRNGHGLLGKQKLMWQLLLGLMIGLFLYFRPPYPAMRTSTEVLFFKEYIINFGIFYILWVMFIVTGSTNAINLTDGLDGLAVGLAAVTSSFFIVAAYISGRSDVSRYLHITYLPGAGEVAVFASALTGACLGFLWYNSFPASVFMGDTGALALGGAFGVMAVLLKKELAFAVAGGVFVVEALSVIIQVTYFKLTGGKRVFLMAPLHHHYELRGIPESKIVVRFWLVGVIFALLAVLTFKVR
ncbi:phospho-N-acetylmuramoyl-pentapeptide-transferase [bacterium]|nr:phospho-N-acetylmuramoyl-pentapeptide-transferase [bacterium]